MAKFCANCGTQLNEADRFCTNCGAPSPAPKTEQPHVESLPESTNVPHVEPQPEPTNVPHVEPQPAKAKKKNKVALIAILISVVLIISTVVVLFATGTFGGGSKKDDDKSTNTAEGVATKFMDALIDFNAEDVYDCFPSFFWDNDNEEKQEAIEYLQEDFDLMKAYYDDITYEILDVEDLDEDQLETMEYELDLFEDEFDTFDKKDVTDYKIVNYELTIKYFGTSDKSEDVVVLIKYKGQWKVIYPDLWDY